MKLIVALIVIFLFYRVQNWLYSEFWIKNLHVSIHYQDAYVTEGDTSYLVEVIENNKLLPLPMLYVKFCTSKYCVFGKESHSYVTDHFYRYSLYTVRSHERITRKYPFTCAKRGCYELRDVDVVSRDLFLIDKLATRFDCPGIMYVKPKLLDYNQIPIDLLSSVKKVIQRQACFEDPFEFRGIREYQPYDNMRFINWKSTAKTGQLQVNTHFPTISKDVDLYLNLDPYILSHADILQETAIRLAYTIASMLVDSNISFRFLTNGKDQYQKQPIRMESGSGKNHLHQLGIALARIDLTQKLDNFTEELKNYAPSDIHSKQLILISTYRKKDLCAVYQQLHEAGLSLYTIIPEFKDITVDTSLLDHSYVWEVDYNDTAV